MRTAKIKGPKTLAKAHRDVVQMIPKSMILFPFLVMGGTTAHRGSKWLTKLAAWILDRAGWITAISYDGRDLHD